MARQVRKAVTSNRPGYHAWGIERVEVPSAKLYEFGESWKGWGPQGIDLELFETADLAGCIAKIVPPSGTPESHVVQLENLLYERGAQMVRVMPSSAPEKVQVVHAKLSEPKRSLRQVALERAERVTAPRDKDALITLVNAAMDVGES